MAAVYRCTATAYIVIVTYMFAAAPGCGCHPQPGLGW